MADPPSSDNTAKPRILLLALNEQPYFDDLYDRLIDKLLQVALVSRARKLPAVIQYLAQHQAKAIILTDPAIATDAHYESLVPLLINYVNSGGILLCGCMFSSFIPLRSMATFFTRFGLPWTAGAYQRTTVALNYRVTALGKAGLAPAYSQKAVFLKHVQRDAAVYLPQAGAQTESRVFSPEAVNDDPESAETPVAFARVGEDWFAYAGDVNAEVETDAVVIAICGL